MPRKAKLLWDFRGIEQMRREKMAREGKDISWRAVADATGLSEAAINHARQNLLSDPSVKLVLALSKYFGVDIDKWPRVPANGGAADSASTPKSDV